MDSKISSTPDSGKNTLVEDKGQYREAIRKQLNDEVKRNIRPGNAKGNSRTDRGA